MATITIRVAKLDHNFQLSLMISKVDLIRPQSLTHQTKLKGLPGTNTLAYFQNFEAKFAPILGKSQSTEKNSKETRAQCYKTFYSRNI